jgi:hypothetical protein
MSTIHLMHITPETVIERSDLIIFDPLEWGNASTSGAIDDNGQHSYVCARYGPTNNRKLIYAALSNPSSTDGDWGWLFESSWFNGGGSWPSGSVQKVRTQLNILAAIMRSSQCGVPDSRYCRELYRSGNLGVAPN